ncbi:hypothetical protein [Aeromonas intestinalis]
MSLLSAQTAKKLPRRELEYIVVQASEELARLERYIKELEVYVKELCQELDDRLDGRESCSQ